ncbi:5'-nucleotidase C-terminal domain-containing protein [Halorarum halophilum]|uniref:5'-nucleotidase C-terminal domain-containing protein n=1 Tax=Halorarum halophilum TaxID=2743090 RepID=A0A7D5K9U3_9EURY|nr:5'-nucleotidase C-terminal domain-containing protein [Halobaculum halophilum]
MLVPRAAPGGGDGPGGRRGVPVPRRRRRGRRPRGDGPGRPPGDLLGVVPFPSHLQTLEVRGEDLAAAVRAGREQFDDTHGRLFVSGAAVRWDDPNGTVAVDGEAVDPDRTYRVACTSYLPSVGLPPGFEQESVVEDRGPQHEHLLTHARDGEFGPAGE